MYHTIIQRPYTHSPRSSASSLSFPRIISGNTAAATPSPLRKGHLQQSKADKENAPPSDMSEQHPTLNCPKSKLRLRLKLTPPHPAEIHAKKETASFMNTPTKAPLKISFLSSSTRNNQQDTRTVPKHQQQTSISTIRGNANNTPTKPSPSTRIGNTATKQQLIAPIHSVPETHFTTHFHSGSPTANERDEERKEREERERRTASWFPPIKAIPRSRSAWNLRVEDGKARKVAGVHDKGSETKRQVSEGRFESDFDGRDARVEEKRVAQDGMSTFSVMTNATIADSRPTFSFRPAASENIQYASSAASSTLADSHSQVYLKHAFAASRTSLSPYIPLEPTNHGMNTTQHGTPPPHDALAVITAGHPNDSSSTVNLTLTISDHSSIRSPSPGGNSAASSTAARSPVVLAVINKSDPQSQVSPAASVSSSDPFTLDKSMRSNVGSSQNEMADISASSFAILGGNADNIYQNQLVTPQKTNARQHIVTPSRQAERSTPTKVGSLLSPYTNGLKPISMDAVNAWSPSKAFAYTDQVAGAGDGKSRVLDSSTDESTQEEMLNDSYNLDQSGDTSLAEEQREWNSRFKGDESSLTGVTMDRVRANDGDSTRSSADDAVRAIEQGHTTPEKQADKSINSEYSAAVMDPAQYLTPQQAHRKRTPEMRRKEREAGSDVSNDIFSVRAASHALGKAGTDAWRCVG